MAIMTGNKRMELEENVQDHKSDAMSVMFKLLMYKKQHEKGKHAT